MLENGKTPHGVKQGSLSSLGYKLQYNLKIINMCEKSMKFVKNGVNKAKIINYDIFGGDL